MTKIDRFTYFYCVLPYILTVLVSLSPNAEIKVLVYSVDFQSAGLFGLWFIKGGGLYSEALNPFLQRGTDRILAQSEQVLLHSVRVLQAGGSRARVRHAPFCAQDTLGAEIENFAVLNECSKPQDSCLEQLLCGMGTYLGGGSFKQL